MLKKWNTDLQNKERSQEATLLWDAFFPHLMHLTNTILIFTFSKSTSCFLTRVRGAISTVFKATHTFLAHFQRLQLQFSFQKGISTLRCRLLGNDIPLQTDLANKIHLTRQDIGFGKGGAHQTTSSQCYHLRKHSGIGKGVNRYRFRFPSSSHDGR